MAHAHNHDDSTYYMEQLCTIGICGALGGVSVMMWYQGAGLNILLHKFFHPFVLYSGITLLVLVVIRAVALWVSVGKSAAAHEHDHCCHDHAHGDGHEHDHDHAHCHDHDHDHAHAHEHEHAVAIAEKPSLVPAEAPGHDHDHGWNPWRYAVLLLPITLFFLNMPSQAFTAGYTSRQGRGGNLADSRIIPMERKGDKNEPPMNLQFGQLEQAAYREDARDVLQGQIGTLKGQFVPGAGSREFTLMRLKITCCAADVIPLRVKIVSPEPIDNIKPQEWVEVTGQIQFRKLRDRDEYVPVLQLASPADIVPTEPDPEIYIQ